MNLDVERMLKLHKDLPKAKTALDKTDIRGGKWENQDNYTFRSADKARHNKMYAGEYTVCSILL